MLKCHRLVRSLWGWLNPEGQEILPDDSTLVQHKISDGDTVNVLIEP